MVVLTLIWGYAWVVAKVGLASSGPFDFAALRVLVGVLTLGIWLVATGRLARPVLLADAAVKAGLADRIGAASSIGMTRAPSTSASSDEARRESAALESHWLRAKHQRREGGMAAPAVTP